MQQREAVEPDTPAAVAGRRQIIGLAVAGAAVLAGLLFALSFAASLSSGGENVATAAIDFERRAIVTSLRDEPPQLNSTRSSDSYSGMVLGHVMEGLTRYDATNELAPGVAERWEVRDDGATFWLREDARWSDGEPVTADDFVFAWRTGIDPNTATRYAFIYYSIRNAVPINRGEMPVEALGVRAVGDHVLEVDFESPAPYFDKLVAFYSFLPIREDFYVSRGERYGADAEDLLFNGPFSIASWVHFSRMRLVKNPYYWDRESIELNEIDIGYMTNDAVARLNLYQDGRIVDVDYIPGESLDRILAQRWPLHRFSDGSVWFLQMNHRPERLTSSFHLRRALQLVNDPAELVAKVLRMPSYTVADSLFPSWIRGAEGLLRQEYPPPEVTYDIEGAREHIELAKQELGIDSIPPIVLLSDDTPAAIVHSEYLQDHLRRTLGLEIRIDRQNFKQRLQKAEDGEFDLVIYGWSPDYDDPLSFADLFASWNLNNHGRYDNPELDAQIAIAQQSSDQRERMQAFGEVQRILIEDAVIITNYERGVLYVQDPRVTNVARRAIGPFVDYTRARLVDPD